MDAVFLKTSSFLLNCEWFVRSTIKSSLVLKYSEMDNSNLFNTSNEIFQVFVGMTLKYSMNATFMYYHLLWKNVEKLQTNTDVHYVSTSHGQDKYMPYTKISIKQSLLHKNQVCHRTSHQLLQVKVHHTRICGSTYGLPAVSHHVKRIALLLRYFLRGIARNVHDSTTNYVILPYNSLIFIMFLIAQNLDSALQFPYIHHVFDSTKFNFCIRKV